jgi:transposase InsO family protein
MVTILCAVISIFEFRIRSRASLELELVALRHQVTVLRRQRPGRPQLSSLDRLLWVWLYRIWPQVIDAMVLVKPATVVQWHRMGFRLYWRWQSRRPGRPKIGTEIRDLIRRMSKANPLWGAPRIHGELLKLGIKISQATVGRWMPWRPTVPSPTWRTFLRNHLPDIAAIDMFVVATATFRLIYALIVLSLDRRRVVRFEVTQNPTQDWLSGQMTEAFPWNTTPRYLLRDRDKSYGLAFRNRVRAMGIEEVISAPRSPWQNPYAERLIGSIRRECLDHVIILNERHLRRVLSSFFNIIMTPEHISRSTRTAHDLVACNFPPQAILLHSPRSAVCIIAMSVEPRELLQPPDGHADFGVASHSDFAGRHLLRASQGHLEPARRAARNVRMQCRPKWTPAPRPRQL